MWFIIPATVPALGPSLRVLRVGDGVLEVLLGRPLVDVDMVSSKKIIYIYNYIYIYIV